jgi:hypothetical protein
VDGAVGEDAVDVHGEETDGGPAGGRDEGFHGDDVSVLNRCPSKENMNAEENENDFDS